MFTVTDIKHYAYCPVIIYIKYVVGLSETTTEYMRYGKESHDERKISPAIAKYKPVRVLKNPYLECKKLKLKGSPDYLLLLKTGHGIVMEVKWAEPARKRVKRDHRLQLGGYALLSRCQLGLRVGKGVVYYLRPSPRLIEVKITESLLKEVEYVIRDMRRIAVSATPPEPRLSPTRCKGCNYVRICPSTRIPQYPRNRT